MSYFDEILEIAGRSVNLAPEMREVPSRSNQPQADNQEVKWTLAPRRYQCVEEACPRRVFSAGERCPEHRHWANEEAAEQAEIESQSAVEAALYNY